MSPPRSAELKKRKVEVAIAWKKRTHGCAFRRISLLCLWNFFQGSDNNTHEGFVRCRKMNSSLDGHYSRSSFYYYFSGRKGGSSIETKVAETSWFASLENLKKSTMKKFTYFDLTLDCVRWDLSLQHSPFHFPLPVLFSFQKVIHFDKTRLQEGGFLRKMVIPLDVIYAGKGYIFFIFSL